jgi:hypothetical protein
MGPIVAADTVTAPVDVPAARRPARPPSGTLPRVVAGVPTLALAAVVMVPWLAGNALIAGVAIGVRALPGAPRALMAAIDYAGSIALGR